MAAVTIKEQFPSDLGDGTLVLVTYPDSEYVTVISNQDHHGRGEQKTYLIVDKQELINAITKEV